MTLQPEFKEEKDMQITSHEWKGGFSTELKSCKKFFITSNKLNG